MFTVLVAPTTLPAPVGTYLSDNRDSIGMAYVYGGPAAVSDDVLLAVQAAISG